MEDNYHAEIEDLKKDISNLIFSKDVEFAVAITALTTTLAAFVAAAPETKDHLLIESLGCLISEYRSSCNLKFVIAQGNA